jgi:hypothetical protein
MIYIYNRNSGKLVPKPERRPKLTMSDAEREHQRKGQFRDTDNDGNVDLSDIRQHGGVYSGGI